MVSNVQQKDKVQTSSFTPKHDTYVWPKKNIVNGRGQVVEHGVDGTYNLMVRMVYGKEAAEEERKNTLERREARKQWLREQPRFKGSVAKKVEQKNKEKLQKRLASNE